MNNFLISPVFWSFLISMFTAQFLKCFVEAKINHKWSFKPFMTNGGMPSSHVAATTGLANSIGLTLGYGSVEFVISLAVLLIVSNDAVNVRLQTGQQGDIMNKWSKIFSEMVSPELFQEEHFKTLVGHTKLQVLWGMIVGVIVSTFITVCIF